MKNTTFEAIWQQHLEPKAKAHGVVDGDMQRVRTAVKGMLVSAGWADPAGVVNFVSLQDASGCLTAAVGVIDKVAPGLAHGRRVTRAQVLAASAHAPAPVTLEPATQAATMSFAPIMASFGERCPRCSATMEPVALVNEKAAVYCHRDRVVLPLPAGHSVRDA